MQVLMIRSSAILPKLHFRIRSGCKGGYVSVRVGGLFDNLGVNRYLLQTLGYIWRHGFLVAPAKVFTSHSLMLQSETRTRHSFG